jgi:transposase
LHTRRIAAGETISEKIAMRPYTIDLRERVAAAVDHQEGSLREIARRFRVSLSFIVRLLQRRRDADTLEPNPHGGGPPPVLGPDDQQLLAELIREQPDATLESPRSATRSGARSCSMLRGR